MHYISYGKKQVSVNLSGKNLLGIIKPLGPSKIADTKTDFTDLENIIQGRKKALIVVPDITRKAHLNEILEAVLPMFEKTGCEVEILIATGLHKAQDKEQINEMFGQEIAERYRIISHTQDKKTHKNLGVTSLGVPIVLNKLLLNHDFIMTIGVIEPHLYAGFSGGPKTIAIGCAGEPTINATHSLKFLGDENTKLCETESNPFHQTLWEIIKPIKIDYSINLVNDAQGNLLKCFSGQLEKVYKDGIKFVKENFILSVDGVADAAICGLGFPKDSNLYQASRVINYLLDVENPIIKTGGCLIIAAELSEGAGNGIGEIRFYKDLRSIKDPAEFLSHIKKVGFKAGGHRTYMVLKHLRKYDIVFVSGNQKLFENTPFKCFSDINDAINYASKKNKAKTKFYIYPKTLNSIAKATNPGA
ncbi:MAG: nickel-dependent lactate racemase [Patescibacteria group bacterium]